MTKMELETSGESIAERAKNFHWNLKDFKTYVRNAPDWLTSLKAIKDDIVTFISSDTAKKMGNPDLLYEIFSRIYQSVGASVSFLQFSLEHPSLGENSYYASLFSTLCSFLHTSNRIKSKSLKRFILDHHPLYLTDENKKKVDDKTSWQNAFLGSEVEKLRHFRHRLLSPREVYIKNLQWAAMSKDSEYEWSFYYDIMGENESLSETVKDTFKRIKNLYTDIDRARKSPKDSGYKERLQNAYKKFISKLSKIEYVNYLALQSVILSYIWENDEDFGLNLYRLERKMKLSITAFEIDRLSKCQSDEERRDALAKYTILAGISFPKVYESFRQLSLNNIIICASEFPRLLNDINIISCLILDELVENRMFGDDWESLFRTSTNELVEIVFDNPLELDFPITTESQKWFMDLLAAPIADSFSRETGVSFHLP